MQESNQKSTNIKGSDPVKSCFMSLQYFSASHLVFASLPWRTALYYTTLLLWLLSSRKFLWSSKFHQPRVIPSQIYARILTSHYTKKQYKFSWIYIFPYFFFSLFNLRRSNYFLHKWFTSLLRHCIALCM